MLERKIMEDLIKWKNDPNKQCLVIKGARQVGKTYIIREFAKNNYDNFIEINFIEKPSYKNIFKGDLDAETIIKEISLYVPNVDLIPNKTLLFLDEIQDCPEARTAIKFLVEAGMFDVIASGSLLGINYKEVPSFPVGYTKTLNMYSLDFEEFLWANGVSKESISFIKDYFYKGESVPVATHEKMMDLFKEFIVVGGMPKVVSEFIATHNFSNVIEIQKEIVNNYLDDIAKYANGNEKAKARECFLSIPNQLAKPYKKFQYSLVESGGTARKYAGSISWLVDAGLVSKCYNLRKPELPLKGNAIDDEFKIYMNDTGLLISMLDEGSSIDIIDGNLGIYKGAIYENIIAETFTKTGKDLFYFNHRQKLEMDFFIKRNNELTAIDVKSADNTKSKSMQSILSNWNVKHGIKLSSKNISKGNNLDYYPLYMAMFL